MSPMTKNIRLARYHNTNSIGVAIIAILTHDANDKLFDWTAHIGASRSVEHAASAYAAARQSGNKLSIHDAHHYFPYLAIERYRQ